MKLSWKPAPYIYIYNPEYDFQVSKAILEDGVWDRPPLQGVRIFNAMLKVIKTSENRNCFHWSVYFYTTACNKVAETCTIDTHKMSSYISTVCDVLLP